MIFTSVNKNNLSKLLLNWKVKKRRLIHFSQLLQIFQLMALLSLKKFTNKQKCLVMRILNWKWNSWTDSFRVYLEFRTRM